MAILTPYLREPWAGFVGRYGDCVYTRVIFPWILSTVFYWVYGLLLLAVDMTRRPGLIYGRKHQPKAVLKPEGSGFMPPLKKCLLQVAFNQLFVLLPGLLCLDWVSRLAGGGIRVDPVLPAFSEIAIHSVLGGLLVEVFFFASHRLLHLTPLYIRFHKQHHEYKAPIGLAAIYAHPIEALIGNCFAVMGPPFLVGFHAYSWYIGICLGFFSTQSSHSGYNIDGRFHDIHHEFTTFNYGSFGLLDRLFGTFKSI